MKIRALFLCLVITFLPTIGLAAGEVVDNGYTENIKTFSVKYIINKDSSVDVTENITYDFGNNQKHGIKRYIQTNFRDKKANISDIFVTNTDKGKSVSAEQTQSGEYTLITIGNPDFLITGIRNYQISYKLTGAFNYFSDKDEFYWQVTGTGWKVPISNASATVDFSNLDADKATAYYCYAGTGSSQNHCQKSNFSSTNKTYTFLQNQLAPQNGLTIALAFAPGSVEKMIIPLGFVEKYSLDILIGATVLMLLLSIASVLYVNRYMLRKGTIIPQYEPPTDMTPIEAGVVLDTKANPRDISAELIYLAINGYLRITKIETSSLFGKGTDYELTRLKGIMPNMNRPYDGEIFDAIFKIGDTITISELKKKPTDSETRSRAISITNLPQSIRNFFTEKGLLNNREQNLTMSVLVCSFIIIALIAMLGAKGIIPGLTAVAEFAGFAFIGAFFLVFGFIFFSGWIMKPLTKAGSERRDLALGLKMYIKAAEIDRIKFHNAPEKSPEQFEKLLPYAMVFGLEKEWAKQFEGISTENPNWYFDPDGTAFAPVLFADSIGTFSSGINSSFSSNSSGSGGGGSVGGGGGGGGGSSW